MKTALTALGCLLALGACATKPVRVADCNTAEFARHDAIKAGLNRLWPDPKGFHLFITSSTVDGVNQVVEMDVWPLSGPQEPAEPKRARVVLQQCSLQLVRAEALMPISN